MFHAIGAFDKKFSSLQTLSLPFWYVADLEPLIQRSRCLGVDSQVEHMQRINRLEGPCGSLNCEPCKMSGHWGCICSGHLCYGSSCFMLFMMIPGLGCTRPV